MQQLALSWVVLDLTRSAFALGTVNFVGALPPALLLLYGGTIADRFSKRKVLIVSQVVFMVGALTLAWLVHRGHVQMWHVLFMAAAMGIAQAFDMPANQAMVPELVERQEIGAAVQLNQAIFHGSRFIGPPLAGWLIARYGTFAGFLVNGIRFVPVIATLFVIRSLRPGQSRRKENALQAMQAGFSYVREHRFLIDLMGITALTTTLVFPNMAVLMPFYVKDVLHQDAGAVGTMMGVSGLGAFLGAMSLLFAQAERRLRRIVAGMAGITIGLSILGIAAILPALGRFGPLSGNLALACVGAAVMGVSISSSLGLVNSIIQQSVPDELRGRVTSLQTLVFVGIMPFSSLLMTRIVDIVGMPRELIGAALGYGIGAAVLFRRLNSDTSREALRDSPPK
jgi:MFS family permease